MTASPMPWPLRLLLVVDVGLIATNVIYHANWIGPLEIFGSIRLTDDAVWYFNMVSSGIWVTCLAGIVLRLREAAIAYITLTGVDLFLIASAFWNLEPEERTPLAAAVYGLEVIVRLVWLWVITRYRHFFSRSLLTG